MTTLAPPVLHYIHHDQFTPAQRAQLTRSHKKVEQLLGVTPSIRPISPPDAHKRSNSCPLPPPPASASSHSSKLTRRQNPRERGKLSNLFGIDMTRASQVILEEEEGFLHRISSSSSDSSNSSASSSSSSTSTTTFTIAAEERMREPAVPKSGTRYPRHRPPRLNLSMSNISNFEKKKDLVEETFLDFETPNAGGESPITPLFKVELGRQRSRTSILEEREWNKIVQDVSNLPISQKEEKSRKLNRLGKVFGVLPPLEMVFPPSPTSRSRSDPRRYTYGLPAPFTRGERCCLPSSGSGSGSPSSEEEEGEEIGGKVMRVVWDTVVDEAGRQRVLGALRELR